MMKQFLKNRPVKILLIILAVLAGITLVGLLYYESQRPNYNDLQKAYNQLEIPSDWKLTKEYSVTGYKGMFCFTAGIDEACPILNKSFKRPESRNSENDISTINNIIKSGKFIVDDKNINNCNDQAEKYYCIFDAHNGDIKLNIEVTSTGSSIELQ